jgi:hypothetical protein
MKQRTNQILYAYWNELRGTRMAPERFDVDPSRISGVLSETFILERSSSRTFTFRLAGTRLCDQYAVELRGCDYLELAEDDDRPLIEHHLDQITHQGAAGLFEMEAPAPDGRKVIFETLILPLVHTRGVVNRFLGAAVAVNPEPWVGTVPLGQFALLQHKLIWPDGRPFAQIQQDSTQTPLPPEAATARVLRFDRRQFRVFDGGRSKS